MRIASALLVSLVVSAIVGFFTVGAWLYRAPIGVEWWVVTRFAPGVFPGSVLAVVVLALLAGLGFALVRRAARARVSPERRRFLTGSLAGGAAAVASIGVAGFVAALRS